ncbi:hypothetical protein RhiirA1_506077 [Rhizophagus irregularis]|uniref:Uncharacterized protein n=1 Tax=Rhizophagus irregularis TaxID=588596 RepID=A0A2N0RZZ6_9GLOM|nr:hypothetical protein RhiirA1_506077 [Rhizophagus irregularis]
MPLTWKGNLVYSYELTSIKFHYILKQSSLEWSILGIRRPDFLKIPEHPRGLELDIYPQYGFAIEVQGKQHEQHVKHFQFEKQLMCDQLNKDLCEKYCIVLRYVWYYEDPYIVIPEHLHELGLIE